MQIPKNAIVLGDITHTRIKTLTLNPMVGVTETLSFYFPRSAIKDEVVEMYPPTLVQNRKIIARSDDVGVFTVLEEHAGREKAVENLEEDESLKEEDKLSKLTWSSISNATKFITNSQILEFLKTKNLFNTKIFELGVVEYRVLSDENFYKKVTQILEERQVLLVDVFKYSLKYADPQGFKILAKMMQKSLEKCSDNISPEYRPQDQVKLPISPFFLGNIRFLDTTIIKIDKNFGMRDFWPLIKAK